MVCKNMNTLEVEMERNSGEHNLNSAFSNKQSALILIINLKDQELHPCLILSQHSRNKYNNIKNSNNISRPVRKHTERLTVRRSETRILTISFTV